MADGYSYEIAERISEFLTSDDWHFRFDEEKGVFQFGLTLHRTKIKKVEYLIRVRQDDYILYAVSPLSADENDPAMMARMAELLCRINYGLRNGNFEMDYRDGEIRYKSYVDCEEILPSSKIIRNSIYIPATSFEGYGDAIVSVMFTDVSAEDAYEESMKRSLRSYLDQGSEN